jgi:hypothetical protein
MKHPQLINIDHTMSNTNGQQLGTPWTNTHIGYLYLFEWGLLEELHIQH